MFTDSLVCVLTYWPMKFMGTAQLPKNVFKIQSTKLVSDITLRVKDNEGKNMHAGWFAVSINCVTCRRHVLSPASAALHSSATSLTAYGCHMFLQPSLSGVVPLCRPQI